MVRNHLFLSVSGTVNVSYFEFFFLSKVWGQLNFVIFLKVYSYVYQGFINLIKYSKLYHFKYCIFYFCCATILLFFCGGKS